MAAIIRPSAARSGRACGSTSQPTMAHMTDNLYDAPSSTPLAPELFPSGGASHLLHREANASSAVQSIELLIPLRPPLAAWRQPRRRSIDPVNCGQQHPDDLRVSAH